MEIVFQNEEFVVVDKPAGMLTVPARAEHDLTRPVLGLMLQDHLRSRVYPVHRLDFVAAGLVLFAKTPVAHRHANAWFENRQIAKTYRALTQAQTFSHIPASVIQAREMQMLTLAQKFEWHGNIRRGKRRAFHSPKGQPSHTVAQFLGHDIVNDALVWDLAPVTGRPHQLRLDLSTRGYPILGDVLYGSQRPFDSDAIALNSYRLDFSGIPPAQRFGLPALVEKTPPWVSMPPPFNLLV